MGSDVSNRRLIEMRSKTTASKKAGYILYKPPCTNEGHTNASRAHEGVLQLKQAYRWKKGKIKLPRAQKAPRNQGTYGGGGDSTYRQDDCAQHNQKLTGCTVIPELPPEIRLTTKTLSLSPSLPLPHVPWIFPWYYLVCK